MRQLFWSRSMLLLLFLSKQVLSANEVDGGNTAVVINKDDPFSVATGQYYVKQRAIPPENVIRVSLGAPADVLSATRFQKVQKDISRKTEDHIQAYALAWSRPYRVECMSITSAISIGFDRRLCANGCEVTRQSSYYNSHSRMPFVDHHIRPSMLLAAETIEQSKKLIDRGVASDYSRPAGDVFLLDTSDRQRNVRSMNYSLIMKTLGGVLNIRVLKKDWIDSKSRVLAYFTGMAEVPYLDTIQFLPGAVADHLTSAGGVLFGSRQMSSIKWLGAGATGSYGAVVEPCNFPGKFPNPGVFLQYYINGETLVEAYWKSVSMPGQGVFIGDPLANPYKGCRLIFSANRKAEKLVNKSGLLPVMREATRCSS